jgi:hypothetical protein
MDVLIENMMYSVCVHECARCVYMLFILWPHRYLLSKTRTRAKLPAQKMAPWNLPA